MPKEIIVVGAGGFGRETLDVIEAINMNSDEPTWHVTGVIDDSPADIQLDRINARGYEYLGTSTVGIKKFGTPQFTIGIGSSQARAKLAGIFENAGWNPVTLVHPTANIGSESVIEPGSVICGGVQLSTNIHLGRYTHLNPAAVVGHDSDLGDFVSVNPGAIVSGDVKIRNRSLIGAGAVVLQGLTIGEDVIVGASACVTRAIEANSIVKGVPAG